MDGAATVTPYYQDHLVSLYCGDCRVLLPELAITYDHSITDPPYDLETHSGARSDLRTEYRVKFEPLPSVVELVALVKPRRWALAFCSLEMLGDYRRACGDTWVRGGFWDRVDGAPQFTGDRPAQPGEGIAIWHAEGKKRWNGGGKRGIWRGNVVRGDERVHETQKPEALMRAIVLDFTDPGELILDPYAGSGTTGVSAKICGRRAVLIEKEEDRCELAANRLRLTDVDERIAMVAEARSRQSALVWEQEMS